ncbi:MAG TPA: glycerol-3-phosphate 1-O-acyltransferase PlsY [Candidatus Eisenbacteria bacterium]|nr:glycerol-3-phosphate 1-O-acyltransferase PlsY [Candidatus Eisenbacteria bacterium]
MDPIFIVAGFALGSIPSGLWIGRARGKDLRASGSRNIGATNAFRVLGPAWGGLVFLLDTAKGFVASFAPIYVAGAAGAAAAGAGTAAAGSSGSPIPTALAAGFAAILGHMFSPLAGFKGGRGVATSLGVFLGVATLPTLLAFGVWVLLFALSRRVSVGSIGAALLYPFLLFLAPPVEGRGWVLIVGTFVALLVIVRHIPNIKRLLQGTEPALIGKGAKPHAETPGGKTP